MRVIDIRDQELTVDDLVSAVADEDVVLMRNGHALARVERLDDDGWDDWLFEHSPEAIRAAERRKAGKRGERVSIEQLRKELGA